MLKIGCVTIILMNRRSEMENMCDLFETKLPYDKYLKMRTPKR